jgi:hypothetical protein
MNTSRDNFSSNLKKKDILEARTLIKIKNKVTSKDNLCSIPRNLPSLENPLVLLHPVKIIVYALTPNKQKNKKEINFTCLTSPQGKTSPQIIKKIKNIRSGLKKNKRLVDNFVKRNSLKISFIPSAKG